MEHQISHYLFRYKRCALPGVGVLLLQQGKAERESDTGQLIAPGFKTVFYKGNESDERLAAFIAARNGISSRSAMKRLLEFCEKIKDLKSGDSMVIPAIGEFHADQAENIQFTPLEIPSHFFPPVSADVVNRSNHPIIVGDRESDSETMAAFYAGDNLEVKSEKRLNWKVAALILFILAGAYVSWYLYNYGHEGNIKKIEPDQPSSTYRTAESS